MTLRPFISFYGAKWRSAPSYPNPLCGTIVEPFAGSAGYSLRYPHLNVILVEKDPKIYALWAWLVKARAEEILRLPDIGPHQRTTDMSLSEEERTLVGFWINRASSGPRNTPSKWMRNRLSGVRYNGSGSQLFWGAKVRERIARQLPSIRHWKVMQGDYTLSPDVRATWFIDPPYQGADGRHYREQDINYDELAKWVRSRKGQVIACDQEGANWLPFRPHGRFKASCGSQKKTRSVHEVIWTRVDLLLQFKKEVVR